LIEFGRIGVDDEWSGTMQDIRGEVRALSERLSDLLVRL